MESSAAPALVLLILTLGVIVVGGILYNLLVGGSAVNALWLIFVWSSGSPADTESSPGGRFLGILVTIAGLIILSILLSIMTELFTSKMQDIKKGAMKVVEGGHTVILGFSDCTRCLLEELANAKSSEGGGTFVILAQEKKEDVENKLYGEKLKLMGSRCIIRSGNPCVIRDLNSVSVSTASVVMIMADPTVPPEASDAKSIRAMLALKTKGWPTDGRIVVQCCSEANRDLFCNLYDPEKVEVVVVGDIVAKLMAQSSHMIGLASVFGMMLGFDGDEFYSKEWCGGYDEKGDEVVDLRGLNFREIVFRMPRAVVLGIFTADGECLINPGWDYVYQDGEKVIVLAQDNDEYEAEETCYFDFENAVAHHTEGARKKCEALLRQPVERFEEPSKVGIARSRPCSHRWTTCVPLARKSWSTPRAMSRSVRRFSTSSVRNVGLVGPPSKSSIRRSTRR